ncbi:MAG: ferredoxin reductase family protein [Patescibacteria group bacterium]
MTSGNTGQILIGLGRLMGLLAELGILVQLVLIGRIRVVEQEYGFDMLNRLHRVLGFYLLAALITHPLFLVTGYSIVNHTAFAPQLVTFFTSWEDVFAAFLGLCVLLIAISTSVAIVRRKLRYETWYFIHFLIYLAIALFFSHQVKSGDLTTGSAMYYWYAVNFTIFGLVLVYRFMRPLYLLWVHRFEVERIVQESAVVTSVYITGRNLARFIIQPGQFAHISFLARDTWYTHPFSFSQVNNGKNLRLSIKALGDFTAQIARITPGTPVLIDGPFGVFTQKKNVTGKYLFIAGGIGITPIRALAESLSLKNADQRLLYSIRNMDELVFEEELKQLNIPTSIITSQSHENGYEHGHIDTEKIQRLAPDFITRDIYVCGPPTMIETVCTALATLGVPKNQIHYERFSY